MADRTAPAATSSAVARPIWMKQAEEAKLKSEAEKTAAAKAAFEATFKDVEKNSGKEPASDDSDAEESEDFSRTKPLGPVDPAKCTAAGAGIAGGAACAASSFVVVTKDSDGRKIPTGGALLKVKICPGVGVGGSEQEGMVKDQGDGTYMVTYVVPKRGNYMVHVDCNGKPIMGSPFPVFFSASNAGGLLGMPPSTAPAPFPNLVNQTMPNMPNYSGSVSGAFPGLLGMIPGVVPGASGGVILPGVGSSLGEVCREYLNGRCVKTDCKFNHPPHNLLMTALAATTSMGTLSQVPMAPSAAAMAAAQAIVAAQALQAHAAQVQAQAAQSARDSSGSPEKAGKVDVLKKTLQISNLSPLLTVEQLKQLFSYCGTVVECSITDSKHFAYIEYSKPEEATAALALNNMDVGGRPLNVEMAKSLPPKPAILSTPMNQSSLPMVMQQAVAMQQMQFQQALLMQQTLTSQQAASRAATMKSATELASARAAEISKKLKAEGVGIEEKEPDIKQRSPSPSRQRSKSKSRSPIKYRHSRRSRSFSPPMRRTRDRRSRSPLRFRHHRNYDSEHRYHRDVSDRLDRARRWERERSHDHYSSVSRRNRSRSVSPRTRKPIKASLASPKHHRESLSPRTRKTSHGSSRSPRHHRGSRSSPRRAHESTSYHRRRSRSKSLEDTSYRRRRSRSKSVEDVKYRTRRSRRSKSVEDRVHAGSKRDGSKSEKLKIDERNHEKNDEAMEKHHLKAEDSRDGDDEVNHGILDPLGLSLKKSHTLSMDVKNLTDGKYESKSKRSDMDENDTEKLEATAKNQTHFENNLSDSSEDKRLAASPVLGSNSTSTPVDEKTHSRSKDMRRSEKQSSESRRKDKSETSRTDRSISDKYRAHAVNEDLSRHGRSSSDYKKHEKPESARREKGILDVDSREGGRKASDHAKSKSHKSSSKNLEDIGGRKDRHRSEKRRLEISSVAEDVASDDFGVSETKDRVLRSSKAKSHRTSSPVEDGTPSDHKYNSRQEKLELGKDKPDMIDSFLNKGNKNGEDLEGLREDVYATYNSINLDGDGKPENPSLKLRGHDSKHYDSEGSRGDLMVPRSSMEKIQEKESSFPDEETFAYANNLAQNGRPMIDSGKFDMITDQNYDIDGTNYLDFDAQTTRTSADSKEQYNCLEQLVEDKVACSAKSKICEGSSVLEGHRNLGTEETRMHDG